MALFKCKMCGGDLEIAEGVTIAECEYCGTKQTVPTARDENMQALFNRANTLRIKSEFDKAEKLYEKIIQADPTQTEAYWGLILCKYGIEYVDDPSTYKKIPTCHRASYDSIIADDDYKSALENADMSQRAIYEEQAKEIDRIQKDILALAQKEETYDVFICYKETDANGQRTQDSVIANDIYYQLTNEGFKVFYAAITLEGKLGSAYEPIIFAALNSAKVMLAIGTKPEHFNAVWVKNEWSRYLKITKKDRSKLLIPCYRDMDAYELPDEFAHLQAQDMAKIGFINDIVRGIKKVIQKEESKPTFAKETVNETASAVGATTIAPILKRAFLFLEDGDFDNANEYAEKVLDIDPEYSDAYIVKLLIDLKLHSVSQIPSYATPIDRNPNFVKALRFAKGDARAKIGNYNQAIVDRIELDNKKQQYANACALMSARKYDEAIATFSKIKDFKDSAERIETCKANKETDRKEAIYAAALRDVASSSADDKAIKNSISALQSIKGYKDADAQVEKLQVRLEKWYEDKKIADEKARIKAEQDRLEAARLAELRKIKAEQNKKKAKKIAKIAIPCLVALIILVVLTITLFIPMLRFNKADKLFAEGKYDEANSIYHELDGFSNSDQRIAVVKSITHINVNNFNEAIQVLLSAGVPVELTYKTEGGSLTETQTLMANSTLSLDDSMVSLNAEVPATTLSDENNVFTFNTSADFTGLKTPGRNGYRFVAWVLDTYSYDVENKDAKFYLSLKATWSTKDYTISYDLAGGKVIGINKVEYDPEDESFTLINPTRTGYTFMGWTGTGLSEPTVVITIAKGSYGNKEYTATWKANEYTITYDAAGGKLENNTQIIHYDEVLKLPTPTRNGYAFLGWYDGTKQYKNSETWKETENVTLKAKWSLSTYSIEYNLNGGTNASANPTSYNITSNVVLANPTRVGYTFDGWTYEGQNTPVKSPSLNGMYGNKTFTANWTPNSYTITLDPNGGTCSAKTLSVTYNSSFSLPTPKWEGHTFSGWYNGGTKVTSGTCKLTSDTKLVAKWDDITYTITYTMNGGTNPSSNPTKYTCNDKITLAEPSRTGYTFLGWTYSGQTTPTKNVTISIGSTGNKTYTANWKANGYTVTFDANNGKVSSSTLGVTYDTSFALPTPTRTGYTFDGWYNGSTKYTSGTWKTANNISLTAKWTANTYKATYNVNGGSVSASSKTYTYDATYTLLTPERTGYEFLGWYSGDKLIAKSGKWQFTENLSLTAKWKVKVYTVTYDAGAGTSSASSAQATYDSHFTLATASRVGYTFDGWYYNGTKYESGTWKTASNITLTAKWIGKTDIPYVVNHYKQNANDNDYTKESTQNLTGTANASVTPSVKSFTNFVSPSAQTVTIKPDGTLVVNYYYDRVTYDLTYVTNGGNTIKKQTYKYGQKLALTTPTRSGYTFGGWFTDKTLSTTYSATATLNKDTTIYAYWSEENKPTDFTYSGTDAITISEYKRNITTMWIPAYIGGVPVTTIGDHFKMVDRYSLTSVTIGNSVTSIGDKAFYDCDSLTSINIPNSVKIISDSAFWSCNRLTSVTIGDSVESIGDNAFNGCDSLTSVTIGDSVESIGASAFYDCYRLTSINIPDSVTSIGERAFFYCSSLTSVTIGNSVTSIGDVAFGDCSSLTSITLPDSVTSIGISAFWGCSSLTSINIPDSVTSLGEFAFDGCTSLTSITIGNSVKSIGQTTFRNCHSLTSVTIGNSVRSIGWEAFYNCSSLTSIIIPNSVTSIGRDAFYNCNSLISITFQGSVGKWNDITEGTDWNYNVPAAEVVCSNGTITIR